jgi:acyl-CoA thioester hydrolase, YbgC/YbaW family
MYKRKVQYYETDQMGVVHHSNYIRWFEEARIDCMEAQGLPYEEMETNHIVIPVLGISCQYKSMTRFGEYVNIKVEKISYNGIKMVLGYTIYDSESEVIRCTGESEHCFLNEAGIPISLKKSFPKWHEIFEKI